MKKLLSLAIFSFAVFTSPVLAETAAAPEAAKAAAPATAAPAAAQPATAAAAPAAPNPNAVAPATPQLAPEVLTDEAAKDVLKDIVIHKHPEDFAGAQQLALQNRQERMEMLQKSTECVQKAATVEDLYNCQAQERRDLDKIWLSYCDTTVSFLGARRVGGKKNNKGDNQQMEARPKATECDRAMAAVTGRPIRPQPEQQEAQ